MIKKLFSLFLIFTLHFSSYGQCPAVTSTNFSCEMSITIVGEGEFWYKICNDYPNPNVNDIAILGEAGTYTLTESVGWLCWWPDQCISIGYWDPTATPDPFNGNATITWCTTLDAPSCGTSAFFDITITPASECGVFNISHTIDFASNWDCYYDFEFQTDIMYSVSSLGDLDAIWLDDNTVQFIGMEPGSSETVNITVFDDQYTITDNDSESVTLEYCPCDDPPGEIIVTPVDGCNNYEIVFQGSTCQEEYYYYAINSWPADDFAWFGFQDFAIELLYDNVYHIDPFELMEDDFNPCTYFCGTAINDTLWSYPIYAVADTGISYANTIVEITPCPCGDPTACNYSGIETEVIYSCSFPGCIDSAYCNFDPLAECDDGSCFELLGCIDSTACNYNSLASCDDGSCIPGGCTDPSYCNFDSSVECDNGLCEGIYGCTYESACNYDPLADCDDATCLLTYGCMDSAACNYNSFATCDAGNCLYLLGCIDVAACNYNPDAECDDGSCGYVSGCMESTATNYDPLAVCDDGSCSFFADANGDGSVDILDLAFIINDFGCNSDCEGDINGDGVTNILDIVLFSSYF